MAALHRSVLVQMRTMASAMPEAVAACSTSSRCLPVRHSPQCSRAHQPTLRQRAAGSLSAACLRTLASQSASRRRALHITAAAATAAKEETFTYQAEVRDPCCPDALSHYVPLTHYSRCLCICTLPGIPLNTQHPRHAHAHTTTEQSAVA